MISNNCIGIQIPIESFGCLFYLKAFFNNSELSLNIKMADDDFERAIAEGRIKKVSSTISLLETEDSPVLLLNDMNGDVKNFIPLKSKQRNLPFLPMAQFGADELFVRKCCGGLDFLFKVWIEKKDFLRITGFLTSESFSKALSKRMFRGRYGDPYAELILPGIEDSILVKANDDMSLSQDIFEESAAFLLGMIPSKNFERASYVLQ